jgi:hypothetical protein
MSSIGRHCCIDEAERVVVSALEVRYAARESTRRKVVGEVRRFFRHASASGVVTLTDMTDSLVEEFCWSAVRLRGRLIDVSPKTAANRQSFIRSAFSELRRLGLWTDRLPTGSTIDRGNSDSSRPLTANELRAVEVRAAKGFSTSRRSLIVAFALAGGNAEEIAAVTISNVDLAEGSVRFEGDSVRVNQLSEWGTEVVASYLRSNTFPAGERLCVEPSTPCDRGAHCVTVALMNVLREACIGGNQRVTARSIRLGAARQIFESHGLEAAARFLGNRSLDATATALNHAWREVG